MPRLIRHVQVLYRGMTERRHRHLRQGRHPRHRRHGPQHPLHPLRGAAEPGAALQERAGRRPHDAALPDGPHARGRRSPRRSSRRRRSPGSGSATAPIAARRRARSRSGRRARRGPLPADLLHPTTPARRRGAERDARERLHRHRRERHLQPRGVRGDHHRRADGVRHPGGDRRRTWSSRSRAATPATTSSTPSTTPCSAPPTAPACMRHWALEQHGELRDASTAPQRGLRDAGPAAATRSSSSRPTCCASPSPHDARCGLPTAEQVSRRASTAWCASDPRCANRDRRRWASPSSLDSGE